MLALTWRLLSLVLVVPLTGCLEVAPLPGGEGTAGPSPIEASLLGTNYPWVAPRDADNSSALENASLAGVLIRIHNPAPMGMAKVENLTLTFANGSVITSPGYLIVQSDRTLVASIGAGHHADKREVHLDLVEVRFEFHLTDPSSAQPTDDQGTVTLKGPAAP